MRIRQIILLNLILTFLISCGVPKRIQDNFWIKYANKNTGLDSILKIDGYFSIAEPTVRKDYKGFFNVQVTETLDTFYMTYLFFKDGMYVRNFGFYEGHDPKAINYNFVKISNDTIGLISNSFKKSNYWGTYTVQGDTIITNYINNPCSPKVWIASQEYFKILDDTTILQFDYKSLENLSESDRVLHEEYRKEATFEPAIFIYSPILPSSDSWLKNEDWFWQSDSLKIKYLNQNGSK